MPSDTTASGTDEMGAESASRNAGMPGCIKTLVLSGFFALFGAAGALIVWVAVMEPLIHVVKARTWQQVPCTILASDVIGDETYEIKIQYTYEFAGLPYTGARYSFFDLKTSGRAGKIRVIQRYPPGSVAVCYVDPHHPSESVINRNPRWQALWGLLGIPFLLVGGVGLVAVRMKKTPAADSLVPTKGEEGEVRSFSETSSVPRGTEFLSETGMSGFDDEDLREEPGPITLKSEASPLSSFLVVLVVAALWNGIVFGFCALRASDWIQGRWQLFPELILLPFLLIGILLLIATLSTFLSLFNPIPVLTLSRQMIPLGGAAVLSWAYRGSPSSIRQIRITLKGIEEARYTRGTDTITDLEVFYEEILLETDDPASIAQGEIQIQIPNDSMHSLSGVRNKIRWQVRFSGAIPQWPDVISEFPIRVVPHE